MPVWRQTLDFLHENDASFDSRTTISTTMTLPISTPDPTTTTTNISSPPTNHAPASKYRLIIHRLILHNFKSYHGTQTLGPFHSHFTSVIGANGGGKSNCADAIQFVFGKRGSQMRAKKMRELVWQGREDIEARVDVVFRFVHNQTGHYEKLNSTNGSQPRELKISRIIPPGKSSASRYAINDKFTSFQGVQDALKQFGIDLSNDRFLILQGEVEAISLMKPMDYLQFLNSIIGTERYTDPISDAKHKLEQESQERDIQYDRLRLSEAAVDALEAPAREAQDIIRKRIQKSEIKYKLNLLNHSEAFTNISLCEQDIEETEQYRKKIESQIDREDERYRDEETEYNETRERYKKLHANLQKSKSELQKHENEKVHLEQEVKNTNSRLSRLQSAHTDDSEDENAHAEKISLCQQKHESLQKEIQDIQSHISHSQTSLQTLEKKYDKELLPINQKMEEVRRKMLPFSERINKIEEKIQIKSSLLDMLHQKQANLNRDVTELEQKQSHTESEHQTIRDELAQHSTQLQQLKQELHETRTKRDSTLNQLASAEKTKRSEALTLSELEQTAKQFSSFNTVYDELMECKQKQTISGICDKLSNCGSVPKEYSTALFAACQYMNFIVTDTSKSANQCVKHLQKYAVGVGRFIMLDKVEHLREKSARNRSKMPNNSQRLFDLIEFEDEKYATAFYFAIRDTLVARDIEEARKLAFQQKKRHRVVTLAGEIIESSGVMSSSSAPIIQRMQMIASLSSDVQEAKRRHESASQLVQQHSLEKKSLDEKLSQLEKDYMEQRLQNEKLSIREKQLRRSLQQMQNASQLLMSSSTQNMSLPNCEDTPQQLEEKIQKLKEALATVRSDTAQYETQLEALENQRKQIGGSEMHQARRKLAVLREQLEETKSKLAKNGVKKTQLEKQRERAQAEAKRAALQQTQLQTQLKQHQSKLDTLTENGQALQEKVNRVEQDIEHTSKQLEECVTRHEEYSEQMGKLRQQLSEVLMDEKNLHQKQVEYKKQENYWKNELRKEIRHIEKGLKLLQVFDFGQVKAAPAPSDDAMVVDDDEVAAPSRPRERHPTVVALLDLDIKELDQESLSTEFQTLEAQLFQLRTKSSGIKLIVNQFKEKKDAYTEQHTRFVEATERKNTLQALYDKLRKDRLEEFMKGFTTISLKLKEIYQMLTMGGDAELELVDRHDPFKGGIIFSVKPPRKSWKKIQNLSGGEKTLSSLALIFALHHFKPTPIYVMDEIDAALDVRNVAIVAHYIKQRTQNAQFVVISLRNSMFELADRLVGIFKVDNRTQSVCVEPRRLVGWNQEGEELGKEQQQQPIVTAR